MEVMEVTKAMEVMEVTKVMEVIKLMEANNRIIIEMVKTIVLTLIVSIDLFYVTQGQGMTTIGAKVKSCFLLSVIENLPLNPLWKTMNTPKIIGAKTTPKTTPGAGLVRSPVR